LAPGSESVCVRWMRGAVALSGLSILHCSGVGTTQLAEEHGARRAVDRWPPVAVCIFMLQKIGSWKGSRLATSKKTYCLLCVGMRVQVIFLGSGEHRGYGSG
jgi:hypothetical protein